MNGPHFKLRLVLLAASLWASGTSAAEPVSRSGIVERAVAHSPQVAAAASRREQSEAEQRQADAARWPQVTLDLGAGPSLRAELVPGTGSDSTRSRYDLSARDLSVVVGGRLSVVQPLYTFGKIDGFRRAAALGVEARKAQAQMTRAEVALEAARLYEAMLFARDATRFFEELENYVERAILSAQERAEDRDPDDTDVLRLQAALAAVRLSLHYGQSARAQAQAGLVAYLGLPTTTSLEPREDELQPLASARLEAAGLVAEALRSRPERSALEHGARAFDALAAAERAGYLPDVFVLGFADGAYTPGRDLVTSRYVIDPLYHFEPGLLVGMRWQVQGPMAGERAEERAAQARELRHLQRLAITGMPAQVKAAFAELSRAHDDLNEAREGVARSKRWMVEANRDYLVGLTDSRNLVDAVRSYAELRTAQLDATFRYNTALAQLAYATGSIVGDRLGLYPGKERP